MEGMSKDQGNGVSMELYVSTNDKRASMGTHHTHGGEVAISPMGIPRTL
jgi:hypothetical protein